MTTILDSRALTDARQPLAPEFVDLLTSIDAGRITFHRKEFRAGFASLTDGTAQFAFEFTTNRRRELFVPWSESVERELFRRGVAMDRPEDEAVRGGRLLLSALAYLDLAFGPPLVDAAIRDTIVRRFAQVTPLRDLVARAPEPQVERASSAFVECASMISNTIDGYGNSLKLELGYPNQEAFSILLGAIYFMFDRRHQLSTKHVVLGED